MTPKPKTRAKNGPKACYTLHVFWHGVFRFSGFGVIFSLLTLVVKKFLRSCSFHTINKMTRLIYVAAAAGGVDGLLQGGGSEWVLVAVYAGYSHGCRGAKSKEGWPTTLILSVKWSSTKYVVINKALNNDEVFYFLSVKKDKSTSLVEKKPSMKKSIGKKDKK